MKPNQKSNPFLRLAAVGLAAAALAFTCQSALAANLTWDADTGTAGAQAGSGTWDTTNTNWWNGTANTTWVNNSGAGSTTFTSTSNYIATLGGTDGTYTINPGAPVSATHLVAASSGYTLTNNGTNFLSLSFANTTGSSTTETSSALRIDPNKTFNIGSGSESTIVKLNAGNTGYSSQVLVSTGATLNINAGASVSRDNSPANGGIRFVGNGTINLHGTLSLLQGNDGIRISERDGDSITFNVKNGGQISVNTTAGNQGGASLWIAGGQAGSGSGVNTLNIESGGSISVLNTSTAFGLTRGAGPSSVLNLHGTLTAPKVVSSASTATFNFEGGTLTANSNQASFMTGLAGTTVSVNQNSAINNGGYNIGIGQAMVGSAGLTFQGSGTTILSGTHSYSGATAVATGSTLDVAGSLASNITVNGLFKGIGSTSGSITFNAGSSLTVDPGDEFAANGATLAGSTTLIFSGALTSGNTYDVIDYGAGGLSGSLSNLVKTSRGTLGTSGTMLQFTAGSVATGTWNTSSGTWQVGGPTPWTNGDDNQFWNGDSVIFDDTPGADTTVTVSGTVVPAAINVSASTSHTFTGSGSINGTGVLTKSGSGNLTIGTANSYSGGTTVNGGKVIVGTDAALGSGSVTLGAGALNTTASISTARSFAVNDAASTIEVNTGATYTVSGAVSGTGTLNKTGDGALTVSNTTSLTGGANVTAGTLTAANIGGTASTATIHVNSGATMNFTGGDVANTLTGSGSVVNTAGTVVFNGDNSGFSGSFTQNSDGNMQFGTSNSGSASASVMLTNGELIMAGVGDYTVKMGSLATASGKNIRGGNSATGTTTLEVGALGVDTTVSGGINNGGAKVLALTKVGSGALTLAGTNNYTGATNVTAGSLVVNGNISTSSTTVSGGTLQGSGSVAVLNATGGIVAPGNSIESLGAGNVSFGTGATYAYELDSQALNGDLLDSSGTLVIASGSILTLTELASGTLAPGDKLTLISYTGSWNGGVFDYLGNALADDSTLTLGFNQWTVNYNDLTGGGNFTSDQAGATGFVTLTVVPEPGAALLGGLGALALLRRRRH